MDLTQLFPPILALTALVVVGLASVAFGTDSRDDHRPADGH
ncbi:MAG TPA: hypothetical protein VEY67_05585 [Candidatus Dormibacteraeota bacterium]|nr:hypothetical protein [Candidatus Dormibacteraeota bacterium]